MILRIKFNKVQNQKMNMEPKEKVRGHLSEEMVKALNFGRGYEDD